MTHIVTRLCLRDTACVEVCPVDCIVSNPDVVESKAQLRAKYESLIAKK